MRCFIVLILVIVLILILDLKNLIDYDND